MKLSQIQKRIPQTLTNSKDVIQTDREYARRSSRARSTRGQENEAWALYKKFHPGSPEVTFLGTDTLFAHYIFGYTFYFHFTLLIRKGGNHCADIK